MNLVLADEHGNDYAQTEDFDLNIQYGDVNDYELTLDEVLAPRSRFYIDGTPYGGIVDKRCPMTTATADTIKFKGRSMQGIIASRFIMPPPGKTHLVVSGDANEVIAMVISLVGLDDIFVADPTPSGVILKDYRFYRFVDAWSGLRMALASVGMRLQMTCQQGLHVLRAVPSAVYGQIDSERVFFELTCDDIPVNRLVGLGKGEGLSRAVSEWFADLNGNVSQTQTLFGALENAMTYQSTSDDASTLPAKTRSKLKEYQNASKAKVTLPEGVELDVGDSVGLSSAAFNIMATTQVIGVVAHIYNGDSEESYDFGIPNFPEEED